MKNNFVRILSFLVIILVMTGELNAHGSMRGVVYDTGLMYGGKTLSLPDFNEEQVRYDMDVISRILCCNTVRLEGEDLSRLEKAARLAHSFGLKIFFNPWKMEVGPEETVAYMREGAQIAEKLRKEGVDIVFVAGCEYSMFNQGVFEGDSQTERMNFLMNLGATEESRANAPGVLAKAGENLTGILRNICAAVRSEFHGPLTYSSGTWEMIDWDLFDIIGIDYYRNGESEEEYRKGLDRYRGLGKPIVVMEMGCCAYEGGAERGSFGFAILQGTDSEGNAIYENGRTPVRSEKEQADYVRDIVDILGSSDVNGMFVYVFRYPIYPYRRDGADLDMTSYALVKSFPSDDERAGRIPSWEPKEAFFSLGAAYCRMAAEEGL